MTVVSVLVQRQSMFCDSRHQISSVDYEEYRPKDRPRWHTIDDVSKGRTFTAAADVLSATNEV